MAEGQVVTQPIPRPHAYRPARTRTDQPDVGRSAAMRLAGCRMTWALSPAPDGAVLWTTQSTIGDQIESVKKSHPAGTEPLSSTRRRM